jgi:hypothetical protein
VNWYWEIELGLSKENALTICDYIIATKREVNPRLSYKRYTIQILAELSKAVLTAMKVIHKTPDYAVNVKWLWALMDIRKYCKNSKRRIRICN